MVLDVHGGDAWAQCDMPVGFGMQATELISVLLFVLRPKFGIIFVGLAWEMRGYGSSYV